MHLDIPRVLQVEASKQFGVLVDVTAQGKRVSTNDVAGTQKGAGPRAPPEPAELVVEDEHPQGESAYCNRGAGDGLQ